jgi:aspartate dehydrogenase
LEAAILSGVSSVTLTTRKPPASFIDSPLVKQKRYDLNNLTEPALLFRGPAREALKALPQNINIAATLSMAGIGFDRTEVVVIADPGITQNVHEVEVTGDFGRMQVRVENVPAPQNPKTSYLAVMSACATLMEILKPLKIGT